MIKDFIQWNDQHPEQIEAVLCKGCGCVLRSWALSEDPVRVMEINGHVVHIHDRVMVNLPHYAEVEIAFEDGSKHVTPICKNCCDDLSDEQLAECYAHDLAMMEEEDRRAGVAGSGERLARLRARRILKR